MNKIVAIQTPHYAPNYGAQLQAFALGEIVKQLGYPIEYINRRPSKYYIFKNFISKYLLLKELHTHNRGFVDFENKYLQPQSVLLLSNSDYKKLDVSRYSAIIVGSDQIWRDDYFESSFEYAPYLDFCNDDSVKKISYAASFGKNTCSHPDYIKNNITHLLKQFSAISVREESGVDILHSVFRVDGKWVLDPTLLLSSDYYTRRLKLNSSDLYTNVLVTYLLGAEPKCIKRCNHLATNLSLTVKHIYPHTYLDKLFEKRYFNRLPRFNTIPNVLEWLSIIKGSKYVITDSFHGMVFSIIFHKQFVVLNRVSGGTERYSSLLKYLGIEDRLCSINSSTEKLRDLLFKPINYKDIDNKLSLFQEESINYLKTALSK